MEIKQHIHYFMVPLIIVNVLILIGGGFLTPIWAPFVHHIGGDIRTAGKAICIFSIVIGLFTCIAAKIENYFHQDEFFMVFAQAFMAVGYLGYFFVQHPWQLYCVEVWLGIGGGIQSPAIFSLYQRYMPKDKSTFSWGVWAGSFNISIGIAALISAYITKAYGFFGTFSAAFSVAVIGLVIALIVASKIKIFEARNKALKTT